MSSFFEDLNDLVAETPAGKVLAITLAILFVSGAASAWTGWMHVMLGAVCDVFRCLGPRNGYI